MAFNIDPKDLNLQDAAGMQLVELIRRTIEEIEENGAGVFWAERNTTTYSELETAYNSGKPIFMKDFGLIYCMSRKGTNYFLFTSIIEGMVDTDEIAIAYIPCYNTDGWGNQEIRSVATATDEQVAEAVDAWLDENVAQETGYVLDSSLTLSNAAAPADKVGELKDTIDDISEVVDSPNIFDQANATITEGKYLNYTNGNEGTNADYCYINDYIPVEAGEKYFITLWNKSNNEFAGNFNAFTLFYDETKTFISGLQGDSNPVTIPEGGAFIRLSMGISSYNTKWYMIEKSSTAASVFVPYFSVSKLKLPFVTVDINGNGDFTSIKNAVYTVDNGSAIIVMPGVYEENVKAWGKEVHIIGVSRESCIIKDTSGNYSTPPLEIGAGSVQNMTIIEKADGAGTEQGGAYAIHVEDNNLYNKKLLIRNCYIYSDSSSAIGMGLRGGCSVRIEDCEIICAGARTSTGSGPLYFHDADGEAYWGTANLYLHNNVLRNTSSSLFSMLTINSIHAENTTYMHIMYNIFVRSKTPALSQKFNTWNSTGNTDADGWNGLSHMYLEDDSFGNNQEELNYSET